jgi:hypothetical protein
MFLCIVDDDTKEMVTTFIPALTRCPQNATEYLRQLRLSEVSPVG